MNKLTAIIPTKNEINNLEEVINSVRFADEIIVVDSLSTDGTYEKALTMGVKVIQREFDYYAAQKNWAIPQAKYEWILLVDADERVTPKLKNEVIEILKNHQRILLPFGSAELITLWVNAFIIVAGETIVSLDYLKEIFAFMEINIFMKRLKLMVLLVN